MYPVWNFLLSKRQFSILILGALIFFGGLSLLQIPKESTPEVNIPIATVTTGLPGATAADIERLITNKIEERIANNLDDVKNLTSTSAEGFSSIVVEFDAKADIPSSIQKLRDEVSAVEPELPDEASDARVTRISFTEQPIITVAVAGNIPPSEFHKLADEIERRIESVFGVSNVSIAGDRTREVQVILERQELQSYGISPSQVVSAISANNSSVPVGSIVVDGVSYTLAFEGNITDPSTIGDIPVTTSGGTPVYVRDLARISDGLAEPSSLSRVSASPGQPSQPALTVDVFKRPGGDITNITSSVRNAFDDLQQPGNILEDFEVTVVLDNGDYLARDLRNLSFTGMQTAGLVILILLVAIGWREALIAGLAIPLSFIVAFIALDATGNTLNFVSLFSLILAIGILVDSAIVIVEGIHSRMKEGLPRIEAARRALSDFHYPITSGTLTTIAVFAPLFLISGITGEFIASIPFTIISVLFASLIVALGFVPLFTTFLMRRRIESKMEKRQEAYTIRAQVWYREKLSRFLDDRKKSRRFFWGIIVAFFLVFLLPITGAVKVVFFPQEDIDFIFAEIETAPGTQLFATDIETRKVEELLYTESDIESFTTTVGQGSAFGSGGSGGNVASIFINLSEERERSSTEIVANLRQKADDIHSSIVRISQPNSGPPTGAPISISFLGDDIQALEQTVERAARLLEDIPGTTDVTTSAQDDATEFVITIDRAKAAAAGLTTRDVSLSLRTLIQGTEATTITTKGEDVDVRVLADVNPNYTTPYDTNNVSIDDIRAIELLTPNGSVQLDSIADIRLSKGKSSISHKNRKRVASVSAELAPGGNTVEIISAFTERQDELDLPENVTLDVGGESEEVDQSFQEMFQALIIGIIAMFAVLVLQFNSFRHATYVLSVVPLSLIGILVGLAITGKALSFPSMMGFIALSGIVVNNSIILIDSMNRLRKERGDGNIKQVIVDAATSRLRPIVLTTATTVIGIIPLTFASELWAPLAFAIIFGLAFSLVITLLLIPMLYYRKPGKVGQDT